MDNLEKTADQSKAVIGTIDQLLNTRQLAKVGTPLTDPKLEKFCLIYSATLDRRASWQLATRDSKRGRTESNASARAWEALKREDVQLRLAEIADYTAKSLLINKSQIIKDIQTELEVDISDIVDIEDGNIIVKDLKSIPSDIRKTIQSIKQTKHGIEVKLYDKQKARDQLMKHLGMTQEDSTQVNINLDLGRAMEEMHQRVLKSKKSAAVETEFETID
jgi:hypothetical protein